MTASTRALDAPVPLGMWAATARATAAAPTITDIRRGSYSARGWEGDSIVQQTQPAPLFRRASSGLQNTVIEEVPAPTDGAVEAAEEIAPAAEPERAEVKNLPALTAVKSYPNGYVEPPHVPWTESTRIALTGFWKWVRTPFGFLLTLYGLNVVAWGGMLFLLLCGAAPAMCSPDTAENHYDGCNDLYSPRREWIEVDSQILNALFCVTGFGLVPWRFRDLYFLLRWRVKGQYPALRRLAGIHAGWFRLPGSDTLDEISRAQYREEMGNSIDDIEAGDDEDGRLPIPVGKAAMQPLTGVRAPPTRPWLLDFVIWANVWNTFLQCCLCGFMWGLNRFNRPSWSTGLFIALACGVAGAGGIVMFVQGKRVKRCEGVAPAGWVDEASIGQALEEMPTKVPVQVEKQGL